MAVRIDGGGGRIWPGLNVRPGEMRMDPEVVRAAADTLARELDSVLGQSSGSLDHVHGATLPPAASSAFGSWDVGRAMTEGYRTGQAAIIEAYAQLVQQLRKAISLLYSAAGDTERADEYGAFGFGRQSALLDQSGTAGFTRQSALRDQPGGPTDGPPVEVREA